MSSLKAETIFNALFHHLQYQPQSSQAHSWWELPDDISSLAHELDLWKIYLN